MAEDSPAQSTAEKGRMSMLDHLVELRRRLMWSAVAFIACFLIAYYFADPVFNFLIEPLADLWAGQEPRRLILRHCTKNSSPI